MRAVTLNFLVDASIQALYGHTRNFEVSSTRMSQDLYSVEQVAALLGLHVRTVRNHVRDGRLKAVRIGKQYRIAREDLAAFTGRPIAAPESVARQRFVEASSVVQ